MKPSSASAISSFVVRLLFIGFGSEFQDAADNRSLTASRLAPAQLTEPLEAVAVAAHQASLYQEVGHVQQKRKPSECLCEA